MHVDEEKEINVHDFECNKENLPLSHRHMIKCIAQGSLQNLILSSMKANECYIIMDWDMQWLACSDREKMEQWHGKAGMNWHKIIVHLRTKNNEEFEIPLPT